MITSKSLNIAVLALGLGLVFVPCTGLMEYGREDPSALLTALFIVPLGIWSVVGAVANLRNPLPQRAVNLQETYRAAGFLVAMFAASVLGVFSSVAVYERSSKEFFWGAAIFFGDTLLLEFVASGVVLFKHWTRKAQPRQNAS